MEFAFQQNYVRGQRARGRRRAVPPRFPPQLWNVRQATLDDDAVTNNNQEGWHNRFQTIIGRHHPSFYRFLTELIDEQGRVDYNLREIELGHEIRRVPKAAQRQQRERIRNVVANFENFERQNNLYGYLRAVSSHIVL